MNRAMQWIAFVILLSVAGIVLAQHHENGESVKVISTRDIKERLDAKDTAVTMVEVTFQPGGAGVAHRHPGPAFVYVIEGEYELGIDDLPIKKFKAGETFYEPSGCVHRVSRNPSTTKRTRLIATVMHPRGVKEILVPVETKETQR